MHSQEASNITYSTIVFNLIFAGFPNQSPLLTMIQPCFSSPFFSDVNEIPSGLCNVPIMVGLKTSVGAVIAELNGKDPDNENVITDHQANQTVIFRNKQQLFYSMSPVQNSWPFGIRDDSLFKSGVIFPIFVLYSLMSLISLSGLVLFSSMRTFVLFVRFCLSHLEIVNWPAKTAASSRSSPLVAFCQKRS